MKDLGREFRLIAWVQDGERLQRCEDVTQFAELVEAQEVAEFVLLHGNGVYIQILDESGAVIEVRRPGNLH
jgi:hypothetical protein